MSAVAAAVAAVVCVRATVERWCTDGVQGGREGGRVVRFLTAMFLSVAVPAYPTQVGGAVAFLPRTHVLDLHADGWINPHVDSIKFSGGIVCGLSLCVLVPRTST